MVRACFSHVLGLAALIAMCLPRLTSAGAALHNGEEFVAINERTVFSTPPIISSGWTPSTAEIFIGISKIKTVQQCSLFLKNLFDNAAFPERVFFGLVEEQPVDTPSCITEYCKFAKKDLTTGKCQYSEQIKSISLSSYESKGTYYLRHLFPSLMHEQEFCMEASPNVKAIHHWDIEIINLWMSVNNEYAVLSSNLPFEEDIASHIQHLCQSEYNENGNLINQLPREAVDLQRPLLSTTWSGEFSFSKCHANTKVPHDPHLVHLNEEIPFTIFARYD